MKILVCVKQVPDPDHIAITAGEDGQAEIAAISEYRMNRFDEFAVEAAVRIKEERADDTTIDVLTVGPARARDVVKRAMGMGADDGIHLETAADQYISPRRIADCIADWARDKGYSFIVTGAMSEDMMNGQAGPMAAALLEWPCATQVIVARLQPVPGDAPAATAPTATDIYVEREVEGGSREMLALPLPAVIAVQTGINEPRYPSLSNLLRANKQDIQTIAAALPGGAEIRQPDEPAGMVMPKRMRAGRHLDGTPAQKADQLLSILQEKAFI